MSEINFLRFWGDSAALALALVHPDTGNAFDPVNHTLLFTVKRSLDQADADALIQKISTVGGISVSGTVATVSFVPADWTLLKPGLSYFYSLKAISVAGAAYTVASGRLGGAPVATRGTTLAIETVIVAPPGLLGCRVLNLASLDDLAAVDLTEIAIPSLFLVSVGDANLQFWRLRAKADGEVTDGAQLIVSTHTPTRVFVRVG